MAKKNKSAGLTVDFSHVDEGGARLPAGDYVVKVEKVELKEGQQYPFLRWTLVVITGEYKGKKILHITTLKPEALFGLRNMLIAIGVNVPKGKVTLKLKDYVGKVLGVYVEDGEFVMTNGRKVKRTEVVEIYPMEKQGKKWVKVIDDEDADDAADDDEDYDEDDDLEEDEDDSDDDEDDDDEDDDDDDEDDDEDDEDDEDDDEDDDLEDELDELLDDEDDEDDDDDEEDAKKKSGKSSKSAPKGKAAKGKGRMKL